MFVVSSILCNFAAMLKGFLHNASLSKRWLFLLLSVIFFVSIASLLNAVLLKYVFGISPLDNMTDTLINRYNAQYVRAMKFTQMISSIAFFIIPSLFFAWAVSRHPVKFLGLHVKSEWALYGLVILATLTSDQFIAYTGYLNDQMHLPGFLSDLEAWMRDKEKELNDIAEVLLTAYSPKDYLFNVFIMALIPAIGEELLFRGIVQRLLYKQLHNIHWAIILTAIIFSALHFQFLGFIPRFIFGVMFGYIYYFTKDLKTVITAHFFNNFSVVTLHYFLPDKADLEKFGKLSADQPLWALFSFLCMTGLMYVIYRYSQNKNLEYEENNDI